MPKDRTDGRHVWWTDHLSLHRPFALTLAKLLVPRFNAWAERMKKVNSPLKPLPAGNCFSIWLFGLSQLMFCHQLSIELFVTRWEDSNPRSYYLLRCQSMRRYLMSRDNNCGHGATELAKTPLSLWPFSDFNLDQMHFMFNVPQPKSVVRKIWKHNDLSSCWGFVRVAALTNNSLTWHVLTLRFYSSTFSSILWELTITA